VDDKERARPHPQSGLQRASDAASRPFCLAPAGLRRNWPWPGRRGDLAGPRSRGYRRCARALARANFGSNTGDSSIQQSLTVFPLGLLLEKKEEEVEEDRGGVGESQLCRVRADLINGEWVREALAGCWQGATKEHSRAFCDRGATSPAVRQSFARRVANL